MKCPTCGYDDHGTGDNSHHCPASPVQGAASAVDQGAAVKPWQERILEEHPKSDPQYWPDSLILKNMSGEIAGWRALAERAQAQPKLTLALPDYDQRRIVIASDEVIDGVRLVCVAIEPAPQPSDAVREAIEKAGSIMFMWAGLSDPEQQRKCYNRIMELAIPAPEQEAAPQLITNLRAALAAADAEKYDECSWQEFCRVFDRRLIQSEAAQVGAKAVNCFTVEGGHTVRRDARVGGGHVWLLHSSKGHLVRALDPNEQRFVDGALAAPVAQEPSQDSAQVAKECTCPSGNGSLVWPCPQHPPTGDHDAASGALHDVVTRAAKDLPNGCEIRVRIERGAGWVEWSGVGGETNHIEGEGYLSDDVIEAIERATATNTNHPEDLGAANTNKGGEA